MFIRLDPAGDAGGVTEEAPPASEGVTEETPSEESPPTAEETGETKETKAEGEEEVLPFGKHPRWQKMTKDNQTLNAKVRQLEAVLQGTENVRKLDGWLKKDHANVKLVMGLMAGKTPAQILKEMQAAETPEDNLDEYEPGVAKRLRKIDELDRKIAEREAREQEDQKKSTEEHQADLDVEFDKRLVADGFVKADGTPVNEAAVEVMSKYLRSVLDHTARNPDRPTRAEFDRCYGEMMEAVVYFQGVGKKTGLKEVVRTEVPPTGAGSGTPPGAKKRVMSDEERISEIANSY